jgi:hypothetical protein
MEHTNASALLTSIQIIMSQFQLTDTRAPVRHELVPCLTLTLVPRYQIYTRVRTACVGTVIDNCK